MDDVNSRRKREFTSHVFLLLIDVDSRRQSGVNSRQCKSTMPVLVLL